MFYISERGVSALCLGHTATLPGQGMEQGHPQTKRNQTKPAAGVLGSAGAGLAYVGWLQCLSALCTPAPQLREQEPQELQEPQAPSMGCGRNPTGTHSPLKHHCRDRQGGGARG